MYGRSLHTAALCRKSEAAGESKPRPTIEIFVKLASRAAAALAGFSNYGNPLHILGHRLFTKDGEMTITDRDTGSQSSRQDCRTTCSARRGICMTTTLPGVPFARTMSLWTSAQTRDSSPATQLSAAPTYTLSNLIQRPSKAFTRNIRLNGFGGSVTAECAAISDFEGDADLLCSTYLGSGANTLYSSVADSANASLGKKLPPARVCVRRLASAIPGGVRVRMLKMDCEGAELAILRDLEEPERFDSIALEYHHDAYPVDTLIQTILGFGTHQVYAVHGHIIHAIRTETLLNLPAASELVEVRGPLFALTSAESFLLWVARL